MNRTQTLPATIPAWVLTLASTDEVRADPVVGWAVTITDCGHLGEVLPISGSRPRVPVAGIWRVTTSLDPDSPTLAGALGDLTRDYLADLGGDEDEDLDGLVEHLEGSGLVMQS